MSSGLDDATRHKLDKGAGLAARIVGLSLGAGLVGLGIWGCAYCVLQWHRQGFAWGMGRLFVLALLSAYAGCALLAATRRPMQP